MFLTLVLLVFVHFATGSKECPPLPGEGLPNGSFLRISPHAIQMTCDKGFVLVGSRRIYCRDGAWIPPFDAECFEPTNLCPPARSVPNADRFGDSREVGSRTYYSCHEGYFMRGKSMIQCGQHLHWDQDPPVCIARLNKVSDIAKRISNEIGLKEGTFVSKKVEATGDAQGLILDKEVYVKGLELFLLLDRSSSVDPIDLELSKSFFRTLIETFGVDNSGINSKTRLTVITFGDKAEVVVSLTNKTITSAEAAMLQINAIKPEGGGTAMTEALSRVLELTVSLRKEAKKALFLLTDGEPTIGEIPPEDITAQLKKMDFEVFTVGIGRDFNRDRLVKIASEPPENHVLFLDTFKDIETILDLVQNPPPTTTAAPPPGPDACGVDDKGTNTWKPWVTAIVVHLPEEERVTFCAGVLICSQWVLTSSDCVAILAGTKNASQVSVIVGAQNLTSGGYNAYATNIRISAPEPKGSKVNFKLALIKLNSPVPSDVARPACINNHKMLKDQFFGYQKQQVLIQGWGTRSFNASLTTMNLTPAANRYLSLSSNVAALPGDYCNQTLAKETNITNPSRDAFVCAGSAQTANKNREKDSCFGSLGSPLIMKDEEDRYQLLGVQTHHHGCTDKPIISLSIVQYLPWIQSVTGNCQEKHGN